MNILQQMNPTATVCFSGHRPERLPGQGCRDKKASKTIISLLREKIVDAIAHDTNTFINGCMAGWDVLAAEQVVELKEEYPHIQLITIRPFATGYFIRERCWTDEWIKRAWEIERRSDGLFIVSTHYQSGVYFQRNRMMVDHSAALICYWDGSNGGTAYTVRYAAKQHLAICNLYSQ